MTRNPILLAALLASGLGAGAAAAPPADHPFEIRLLQGSLTPAAGVPAAARQLLADRALAARGAGQDTLHVLVQLYDLPDPAQKNALWLEGLSLGAYVPHRAWIAAVPVERVAAVAGRPDVRFLAHWDASFKVHPRVARGEFDSWALTPSRPGWVMTFVQFHHDVALEQGARVAEALGGAVGPPIDGAHGMTVWLPRKDIARLAAREEVLWIEQGPPPLSATNDGVRAQTRADAVIAPPYSLDGTGVRLFVYDAGRARATHETFDSGAGSRVTYLDLTPLDNHPTHVAGTAGGDGSPSSAGGRGVAVDTSILSSGFQWNGIGIFFWDNAGDIQADYALARNTHDADLGTNSIGSNVASNGFNCALEGDYGVAANLLDGIVRGDNATVGSAVMMTWAAGNERSGGVPPGRCGGGYFTTGPPSCAKNPIHVGALNSDGGAMTRFSSWGPCDDGRMKPVVSAPGCETARVTGENAVYSSFNTSDTAYGLFCGTSMATPAVAGIVSLLIEDWRALGYGGPNDRPLPALVKALVIGSARDQGQDGPDFIHGYGSVDAKGLIDLLRAGDGALSDLPSNWGTDSADQGSLDAFTVTVPAGTEELKATLVWDDYPAASFTGFAPVNDLDLELLDPNGAPVQPWVLDPLNPHLDATTGVNTRDNQEQVRVLNPQAGVWTVRVAGTTVPQGPQSYGLAWSAAPCTFQANLCTTTSWDFEIDEGGWTLSGAARVAAPAPGHGSWSLRLGGAVSTTHEATLDVAVPNWSGRALWTFYWYMTTQEVQATGWGADNFLAEVRNPATGAPLAVLDVRYDGWKAGAWLHQAHLDLTPWMGQTIRLAFRAFNSALRPTTFWVDDIALETCPLKETDVWSKDLPADTGIEPDPLPGPMWTSPDIWVRNNDDGGTTHQNPEFGQTNYIYVKVRNRSLVEAIATPVLVHTADASTGLAWPIDWTQVGTATVPSLLPGADTTVVVPWDPPGTGHFCLLSRLVTGQDPMTFPEGADVNANTRNNNNIAWKNVNVVDLVLQASETVIFIYRNPTDEVLKLNLRFAERRSILTHLFLRRGRIIVVLGEDLAAIWAEHGQQGEGIERIDDQTIELVEADAFVYIPLQGRDEHRVKVAFYDTSVPIADVPPITYVYDVTEENASDPLARDPIGGVTYEIQALPPQ